MLAQRVNAVLEATNAWDERKLLLQNEGAAVLPGMYWNFDQSCVNLIK